MLETCTVENFPLTLIHQTLTKKVMKTTKINIIVSLEVECTDPGSFNSHEQFVNSDVKSMGKYLKEAIQERMKGAWQYSSRVTKSKVQVL